MSLIRLLPLGLYFIACIPLDGDPGTDTGATGRSAPPGPHSALALEDCVEQPLKAELVADFDRVPTARKATQLFEFDGKVYFTDHTTIWSNGEEYQHRAPGGAVFGTGTHWIAVDPTQGRIQTASMPEGPFVERLQAGALSGFLVDALGVFLAGRDSLSYFSTASGKVEWSFPTESRSLDLVGGAVSYELGIWLLAIQGDELLVQHVQRESGEITLQQAVPWPHGNSPVTFSMATDGWLGYGRNDGERWSWQWVNPSSGKNETAIEEHHGSGSVNHGPGPDLLGTSLVGLEYRGRWLRVNANGQCRRSVRRFQHSTVNWHSGTHYIWDAQGIWRVDD